MDQPSSATELFASLAIAVCCWRWFCCCSCCFCLLLMLFLVLLLLMMLMMCALFFYFRFVLSFKSAFHQKQGRRYSSSWFPCPSVHSEIHLSWFRLGFPKLKVYPFSHNHRSGTNERNLILDGPIFHWTMIMGGRVMILVLTVSGRESIPRNICFTPIPWKMMNLTIFSRPVGISSNFSNSKLMSYFTPVLFQSIRGSFGGYPSSEFTFCLWSQPMSSIPFTTGCLLTIAIDALLEAAEVDSTSKPVRKRKRIRRGYATLPDRPHEAGSCQTFSSKVQRPEFQVSDIPVNYLVLRGLLALVFQPDPQTNSSLLNHTQPTNPPGFASFM